MENKIIKCSSCGHEIASNAKVCPQCGGKNKKPLYKNWWFWVIIVIVVGSIGSATNNNVRKETPSAYAQSNTTEAIVTTSASIPQNITEAAATTHANTTEVIVTTPASIPQNIIESSTTTRTNVQASKSQETFSINETAVFKDIKVTATEIKISKGESFFTPNSGNVFIGINFTIENTSNSDKTISSIMLFDAYADEIKLSYSMNAAMAFSDGTLDGSLSPGRKMVGWYAVEVPNETKVLELEVVSSWLSSQKAVFVFDVSDK